MSSPREEEDEEEKEEEENVSNSVSQRSCELLMSDLQPETTAERDQELKTG